MASLTFNVHIPLLKISHESIQMPMGTLWQLPFDSFDGLTSGAFSDYKRAYEETRPVFLSFDLEAKEEEWMKPKEEPMRHVMEIKLPTDETNYKNDLKDNYPFNIFHAVHDSRVDYFWETLILAIPSGQFIQPRHSITFINADNNVRYFMLGDNQTTNMANFRGDADLEYLFKPEACGETVTLDMLREAIEVEKILKKIHDNTELNEALLSLKVSNLPYIGKEQFTICMSALENLMIPEVYEDIRKTFSNRIAALLANEKEEYAEKFELCKKLYGERSKAVHGQENKILPFSPANESQILLASCIKALAKIISPEKTIQTLLEELDNKFPGVSEISVSLASSPIINQSPYKLLSDKISASGSITPGAQTTSSDSSMLLYWSPLSGMETNADFQIMSFPAYFTWLNGVDIISLEDKDIRRDFMSQLNMSDKSFAAIGLSMNVGENFYELNDSSAELLQFIEVRNLIVVGLRLAGYRKFVDPELLGNFLFKGSMRYRQPSVLRQSIYMDMRKEAAESLPKEKTEDVVPHWDLLAKYYHQSPNDEISLALEIYRRIHESRYLLAESRASLAFTLLEKIIGPFRPKKDPIQLEDLIELSIGTNESTEHFRNAGRAMRNSIAHGYWDAKKNEADFKNILDVIDKLVPQFLKAWVDKPAEIESNPKDIFVQQVSLLKK